MSQPAPAPSPQALAAIDTVLVALEEYYNWLLRERVMPQWRVAPLAGAGDKAKRLKLAAMIDSHFRLPALAEEGEVPVSIPPDAPQQNAPVAPAPRDIPDIALLTEIHNAVRAEKLRFTQIAERFAVPVERIKEVIGSPDSGLEIKPGGWVAKLAA